MNILVIAPTFVLALALWIASRPKQERFSGQGRSAVDQGRRGTAVARCRSSSEDAMQAAEVVARTGRPSFRSARARGGDEPTADAAWDRRRLQGGRHGANSTNRSASAAVKPTRGAAYFTRIGRGTRLWARARSPWCSTSHNFMLARWPERRTRDIWDADPACAVSGIFIILAAPVVSTTAMFIGR